MEEILIPVYEDYFENESTMLKDLKDDMKSDNIDYSIYFGDSQEELQHA